MSEEISREIDKKEGELRPLRSQMAELEEQFIRTTSVFAAEWFQKTAKQYIAKYPNIILSLSEEEVSRMKREIDDLTSNAPQKVREVLENPLLWWHIKPSTTSSKDQYLQLLGKYPEILDQAIREALGLLGLVLEEFKFHVSTRPNMGTFDEFWFAQPPGCQEPFPSYPHLLTWSQEMQDIIRLYDSNYSKALKKFKEIQLLKDEKKRLEALNRWDSA